MTNKPLIVIGNGGHASVLTELLQNQQYEILGFTSPTREVNNTGLKYLGPDEIIFDIDPKQIQLVLGIGMMGPISVRQQIYKMFVDKGYCFANVIHSSAIIAPSVRLGNGVQIMAGVILQTNSQIADNIIVNTGSIIEHDCNIESNVHIAPAVKLLGHVKVGNGTFIGSGSTIIQGINIGTDCLIGAGSLVLNNIHDGIKAYGVPAKEV